MVRHGLRLEGRVLCFVQGMHIGEGFGERSARAEADGG